MSRAEDACRILVAGSSYVQFPETEPDTSMPRLMAAELKRLSPGTAWDVRTALLYPVANMPDRARSLVESHKPDLLLFVCSTTYAEESVLFRIQNRFPRLYPPAKFLLDQLPAGGPAAWRRSRWGFPLRALRTLSGAVIGATAVVSLEVATTATEQTLRSLAGIPGLKVLCRLAVGNARDENQAFEVKRRVDLYNQATSDVCKSLGIPVFDIRAAAEQAGTEYRFEPDRLHGELELRKFNARLFARAILAEINSASDNNLPLVVQNKQVE